jgi:hypothetical protein
MEQIELIRHAVRTLDALAVPYALVGSWGSGLYGEPRGGRAVGDEARLSRDLAADRREGRRPGFASRAGQSLK